MPLQPSSIARTGESKQKAALKDRDKKKKAPKKNSAESIETEDTIVEKLQNAETRKKAAAHQIAVSTLAMKRQFCPICHVVTENFEEHHKGKMHQCILKMMPKEERDKYRMHEGKLENREKKRLARKREEKSKQRLSHADDLMANEQQRKRPREDGEDGDDGDVAGEDQLRPRKRQKKKVDPDAPPKIQRKRITKEGVREVFCDVCLKWIAKRNLRHHNAGQKHKRKFLAKPEEEQDAYLANVRERKAAMMKRQRQRTAPMRQKTAHFSSWAEAIQKGKRPI